MPRGKVLTEDEKFKIKVYKEAKLSNREIAKKLGRSSSLIDNFINCGDNYGKNRKYNNNQKLTPRQKREIIRLASTRNLFASQIKAELNLPVTTRRVRQILNAEDHLQFQKRVKKPPLTAVHREKRLTFARNHMSWKEEWNNVVFSDEKKFNLDGPDGFQYYWHDLRKEKEVFMSRNFGGGSVMIWAAFCSNGQSTIAWVPTKMNAVKYVELLEDCLLDWAEEVCGVNFIFQHDNAAVHSAKVVKDWLQERKIDVMGWPARSPDLNPIENLWGILSRKVYANGRQFNNLKELKDAIKLEWNNITKKTLQDLINSMPNRIFSVISNQGGPTKY